MFRRLPKCCNSQQLEETYDSVSKIFKIKCLNCEMWAKSDVQTYGRAKKQANERFRDRVNKKNAKDKKSL